MNSVSRMSPSSVLKNFQCFDVRVSASFGGNQSQLNLCNGLGGFSPPIECILVNGLGDNLASARVESGNLDLESPLVNPMTWCRKKLVPRKSVKLVDEENRPDQQDRRRDHREKHVHIGNECRIIPVSCEKEIKQKISPKRRNDEELNPNKQDDG